MILSSGEDHSASSSRGRHSNSVSFTLNRLEEAGPKNNRSAGTNSSFRSPRSRAADIATEYTRTAVLKEAGRRSNDSVDLLEEFTVNKLQFSSLNLYGREEHIKILEDSLDQVCSASLSPHADNNAVPPSADRQAEKAPKTQGIVRHFVVIGGPSGTGKTSLARTLEHPVRRKQGIFARGKFDDNVRNEPYVGIAAACQELCGTILSSSNLGGGSGPCESHDGSRSFNNTIILKFREELHSTLGDELSLLARIIPGLEEIIGECMGDDNLYSHNRFMNSLPSRQHQDQEHQSLDAIKNRFQYALKCFFRVITKYFAPLVLVLDDLQWADNSSIELVEFLLADNQMSGLLIVGCYRSNETEETHMLKRSLAENECKEVDQRGYGLIQLSVDCLSVGQIDELLTDLLRTDDSSTFDLAEICHRKTLGNPFFLIHFIAMLEAKHLLQYNLGLLKWRWDLTEIEDETVATDNVVDLMKIKIGDLAPGTQHCVQLASCLGFVFPFETLKLVWEEYDHDGKASSTEDDLNVFFDAAIEEGILERSSTVGEYRWVHDKIKEAALGLLTPDGLRQMRYRIGRILVGRFSSGELESAIFVVADLLNESIDFSSSISTGDESMQLAGLNLQAAENAVKLSGFESATKYAVKGITLLGKNGWKDCYDLSLQLYSLAAETEGLLGQVEDSNKFCDEILEHGMSFDDKLRAYNAKFDILIDSAPVEAVGYGLSILEQMGCTFPRNKVVMLIATIVGLMRARLSSQTIDGERHAFKMAVDTRKVESMKILDKLFSACYVTQNPLLPLVALRLLDLARGNGLCEVTAVAYALTGILLNRILLDFDAGTAFGNHALFCRQQTRSRTYASRVPFLVYGGVFPLCKPVHTLLKPLLESYRIGMKIGDTLSALMAITTYIMFSFQCGTPLKAIDEDCHTYFPQVKLLKRALMQGRFLAIWQVINNLMGRTDDPTKMFGGILTEKDLESERPELLVNIQVAEVVLFAHLGEYIRGVDIAIARLSNLSRRIETPMLVLRPFACGMCCFAAARLTKKRKYRNQAQKCLTTVSMFVKKGNPNAKYWKALLDAENEALKGNKDQAVKNYKQAIFLSSRFGFIQDAAMANLRLGQYMRTVIRDEEEAVFRTKRAIELYEEWGAHAILERIRQEYQNVVPEAIEVVSIKGGFDCR